MFGWLRRRCGGGAAGPLWIVSGASSSGKSTLIASGRATELTGLSATAPMLFAFDLRRRLSIPRGGAWFHYNTLRPARFLDPSLPLMPQWSYDPDPAWRRLLDLPVERRAIVVVASPETIRERMWNRTVSEERQGTAYDSAAWLSLLDRVNLDEVTRIWKAELVRRGIPVLEVAG